MQSVRENHIIITPHEVKTKYGVGVVLKIDMKGFTPQWWQQLVNFIIRKGDKETKEYMLEGCDIYKYFQNKL